MPSELLAHFPVGVGDRVQFVIPAAAPGMQALGGEGFVISAQMNPDGVPALFMVAVLNYPQLIMCAVGACQIKVLEAGALVRRVALS